MQHDFTGVYIVAKNVTTHLSLNLVNYPPVIIMEIELVILEASEYPINPKTLKNLAEWGAIFIFYGVDCSAWPIAKSAATKQSHTFIYIDATDINMT